MRYQAMFGITIYTEIKCCSENFGCKTARKVYNVTNNVM